jgi:Retroviral aspartyl protease
MAMVDSGSTHSFINLTIVQILELPTISSTPLTVVTASGVKLTSSLLYSQLHFTLQNHSFIADLSVLQVTNHDVIFRMDWYKGEFSTQSQENTMRLHTLPVHAELTLCTHDPYLTKEIHHGISVILAQLFCVSNQSVSSPQVLYFQVQELLDQFSDVVL